MEREILCFEEMSEQALADADRAERPEQRVALLERALRLAQFAAEARARHDAAGPIAAEPKNHGLLFRSGTFNFRRDARD